MNELHQFPVIHEYPPLATAHESDVWKVLFDLDEIHRSAVDKIVGNFAETKKWGFATDDERILVRLRLNFGCEALGFLTLGAPTFSSEWSPFSIVPKIHDAADDAFLWRWLLIDAWNSCGMTQISGILRAVSQLRHGKQGN
jgi:hypothetical protein